MACRSIFDRCYFNVYLVWFSFLFIECFRRLFFLYSHMETIASSYSTLTFGGKFLYIWKEDQRSSHCYEMGDVYWHCNSRGVGCYYSFYEASDIFISDFFYLWRRDWYGPACPRCIDYGES